MKHMVDLPESVGMNSVILARIKPAMQKYVDEHHFAGIITMLSRRGRIVHFEQVGCMDTEEEKPMLPDTIFRIYSMTKPIVCTALMTLFEEGKFQLIDPVAKYIPAFGGIKVLVSDGGGGTTKVDPIRPITIRDLLTHTSGLSYHFLDDTPVSAMYRQANIMGNVDLTLQEWVSELTKMPLAFQPGTRFHYSVGIDVAAHLIEIISAQPLSEFLRERFFNPIGMDDTGFYLTDKKTERLASMYGLPDISGSKTTPDSLLEAWETGNIKKRDVSKTHPVDNQHSFVRGGHGLYSTAWDYMRFAQMLLNDGVLDGERIIGRKTLELMHTNHLPLSLLPYEIAGFPSLGYGFGLGSRVLLNVAESAFPGSVGEFGWGGAAKTYYWVDPKEDIAGVFMTQFMMGFDIPEKDFQVLAYAAVDD